MSEHVLPREAGMIARLYRVLHGNERTPKDVEDAALRKLEALVEAARHLEALEDHAREEQRE